MSFPLAYTGELVFYKSRDFNFDLFIQNIVAKTAPSDLQAEVIHLSTTASYTNLPIKVTLTIHDENTSVHCAYKISLLENNLVFLLSVLFSIFLFYFHKQSFGYLALVFGFLFYFFNTIKISNAIKSIIYSEIGGKTDIGTPELWEQQQQWMKDKSLCPACGEKRNAYTNKCINCGLFFHKKVLKISSISTSSSNNTEVVYEINKTKK